MSAERWEARAEVLRPVSEWAAQELSIALNLTTQTAEAELERALTLVTRLPRVLDALESGVLHPQHLWPLLEHVAPIADDALRARIEGELLDWMTARNRVTTPAALGDRVRRVVAKHNARDAARDLARALKQRGISVRPERTTGMSAVTIVCTTPEGQAFYRALGDHVDALDADPDDTRTRGQKMVDALMDLVLRPGEAERPPVQALLTLVASVQTALGGDALGEVDGKPITAEMARQLVRAFAGLPPVASGTCDAGTAAAPDGVAAGVDTMTDDPGSDGTASVAGPTSPITSAQTGSVDGEPVDAGGGAIERAAAELSGEAFDRWLDDLVRSSSGDAPVPGEHGWTPGRPPDPTEVDTGPWPGLDELIDPDDLADLSDLHRPGDDVARAADSDAPTPPNTQDQPGIQDAPGAGDPPGSDSDSTASPTSGGWWAAADRAVDEASGAVHAARLALGAAQRMLRTAQRADAADEAAWQAGPAGRVNAAPDALGALAAAADAQREELAALLTTTAGGGLADRPRIAVTDAVTGALLALTDLPELRRVGTCGAPACRRNPQACGHDLTGRPGLGAPGPTDGYRPSAALDRFGRARDRHCRFPGCRRRIPKAGELDHVRAYPDGETAAANLAGFCTPNHRGKHQAPGWTYAIHPDATLTVTTPSGLAAVTTPPPY